MAKDDAPNYPLIAESLSRGKCVPFLGAGASIGAGFLSGTELASYLAEKSGFPDKKGRDNLAMLASYYQHGNPLRGQARALNSERRRLRGSLAGCGIRW